MVRARLNWVEGQAGDFPEQLEKLRAAQQMDMTYSGLKLKEDLSSKIYVPSVPCVFLWTVGSPAPCPELLSVFFFFLTVCTPATTLTACGAQCLLNRDRYLCCAAVTGTHWTGTLPPSPPTYYLFSIQSQHLFILPSSPFSTCPLPRKQQSFSRVLLAHCSVQGAMTLLLTLQWWTNIKKTCSMVWKMSKMDIGLNGGRKQMACCLDTQLSPHRAADQTVQRWK